jgi:hypothetical protein
MAGLRAVEERGVRIVDRDSEARARACLALVSREGGMTCSCGGLWEEHEARPDSCCQQAISQDKYRQPKVDKER